MLTLLAAFLLVQDADPARIQDLIRKLGAEDYSAREEASKELRKIGKAAHEALKKAADESSDPEVKERARALLEGDKKPAKEAEPKPAPGLPGLRILGGGGGSVSVTNVNGDATYTITPNDGKPGIVFFKSAAGAVRLDHTDEKGVKQSASADSLDAFLKDHRELAEKHGITAEGIEYGGNKVSFKGAAFNFNFNPPPLFRRPPWGLKAAALFGPLDETLRAQLDLPGEGGAVLTRIPPGSAAEALGLEKHDVLLEIDGQAVASPEDARLRLSRESRGTLLRKGKRETFGARKKDF